MLLLKRKKYERKEKKMNVDLTDIMSAAITLVLAIITVFVIPLLKEKIGAAKLVQILTWTNVAVKAAEQLYKSEQGKAKKRYVLAFLDAKGYKLDPIIIENLVEAAVLLLHSEITKPDELPPGEQIRP